MASGARWAGAAEARKQFARLPQVTREQINIATSETTRAVRDGARQRVRVRTGRLKRSIKSTMDRRRGQGKVTVGAPHGRMVEFGTVNMSARPFLLPAAESEQENYAQRAKDAGRRIERELEEHHKPT